MDKTYIEIGQRIRLLRKCARETRYDLSNAIGVQIETISKYENGYRRPNDEVRVKLAKHFGVSVDYIMYGE